MDEAKRELVEDWLKKAQHDLASAEKLASDPDPFLETAIYHCQQAAEKAVKGFLVFHDQPFEKRHDIRPLISLAAPFHAPISSLMEDAELLTPYAFIFRYPGKTKEPDRMEFERGLEAAKKVYNFILSLLPSQVHPLK